MKTELCDLFNIEYPIIQGRLAHITDGKFAAAVLMPVDWCYSVRIRHTRNICVKEIRTARSLTDKPLRSILIMENRIDEIADVCIEEGVQICTVFC